MPLKITSRWIELDPSEFDALTADKIYYSSDKTLADKISENNTQTALTNPNIDSYVQNGDFVYVASDGKYHRALADGTEKQRVVGMYDASKNAIVTSGIVEISTNVDYGHWVYLSSTNAGKVQTSETAVKVGLSLGGNKILLTSMSSENGSGSGLDADLLDGQHGSFYRNASNLNAGTVPTARLSGTYNISITGNASTATNADKLDGKHGNEYASASHTHTLDSLSNVTLGSPSNGQALVYQNGSWKNADVGTGDMLKSVYDSDDDGKVDAAEYADNANALDGHDSSYFATASHNHDSRYVKLTDYDDSDVLTKIKHVDGSDSGLDADLLDGQHGSFYRNASNLNAGTVPTARLSGTYSINISGNASTATNADKLDGKHGSDYLDKSTYDSDDDGKVDAAEYADNANALDGHDSSYFATASHNHDSRYVKLTDYDDSDVLAKIKNVDGADSGLDADKLDGQHGSFYRNASNLNAGTVPAARLSGTYSINISGNASTATNADKLDGKHGSQYLDKSTYDSDNDGKVDAAEYADNAGNADKLDNRQATAFAYSENKAATNLNTITQSGMYRINTYNANMPPGVQNGQLLVIHGGGDTITQIVSDYSSNHIYWRSGNPSDVGGPGSWRSWRLLWHSGNDGSGSNLDADKLDGEHGSFYRNASNLNAGTVPVERLSGTYNINISGNASTATNANKLDGKDSSEFASATHNHDGRYVKLADYEDSDVLAKIKNVDGSGSGLDADKLDGFHASTTSQANVIPVTDSNGKIPSEFIYPTGGGGTNRGVFGGGWNGTYLNTIDYITISTLGNAQDFGDLTVSRQNLTATSNGTNNRGVFGGGWNGDLINTIDYITISTLGNAHDFGDLTSSNNSLAATSNGTNNRGVFGGGNTEYTTNTIDYITISTLGNAHDFGDLTSSNNSLAATSNGTNNRGVFGGGSDGSNRLNTIDYITISITGNAQDFGDLTVSRAYLTATSNGTNDRGVFGGGSDGSNHLNTIDYITISITGNAQDFGDLTVSRDHLTATSNA